MALYLYLQGGNGVDVQGGSTGRDPAHCRDQRTRVTVLKWHGSRPPGLPSCRTAVGQGLIDLAFPGRARPTLQATGRPVVLTLHQSSDKTARARPLATSEPPYEATRRSAFIPVLEAFHQTEDGTRHKQSRSAPRNARCRRLRRVLTPSLSSVFHTNPLSVRD